MRGRKKSGLKTYRAKRRFGVTTEPKGEVARKRGNAFVIQKHAARRLHYDLRLELDGVMKSWAVTRGPSLVPGEKRLAVQVEDHPIAYNKFEGTIPQGEYGGGTVMIWDRGHWQPENDPHKGLAKGHLAFTLEGEKLSGGWHLVRMHRRAGEKRDNWLLIKQHDEAERSARDTDILEEKPLSAVTGRTMDEIANGPKKEWRSNRSKASQPKVRPSKTAKKAPKRAHSAAIKLMRRAESLTPAEGAPFAGVGHAALPAFVAPCLATLSDKAPDSGKWVHEIKFDGYRIQARLDRGKVKLLTRKGLNWTSKFPTVAAAIAKLPAKSALIDGEVVVEGDDGLSSFSLLQQDLKASRHDRMALYAFDLMHLDGADLKSIAAGCAQRSACEAAQTAARTRPTPSERIALRGGLNTASARLQNGIWKALCRKSLTLHIVRGAVMTGSRPNVRIVKNSWSPESYRRPPMRVLWELLCLASMNATSCTMQDAPEPVSRTKSRARFSASSRPWRLRKHRSKRFPPRSEARANRSGLSQEWWLRLISMAGPTATV